MGLFVGTSGWDYEEWKGGFYPPALPRGRFLEYYGQELGACEVNATFYRVQSKASVARWAEAVPPGFRFAAKAHRRLSHRKKFAPAQDVDRAFLDEFLESLTPLGDRLACVLVQFPEFVERDDSELEGLLVALPRELPCAFEFRHRSWEVEAVRERIVAAGGTVCLSETSAALPERLPPGQLAYVRLRADDYPDAVRSGWLALLEREAAQRDVYAFAKHRDVAAGNPHTGVGLAQWLTARIG